MATACPCVLWVSCQMVEAKDTTVQVGAGTKFLLDIPYRLPLTVTCTTATLKMCGSRKGEVAAPTSLKNKKIQ